MKNGPGKVRVADVAAITAAVGGPGAGADGDDLLVVEARARSARTNRSASRVQDPPAQPGHVPGVGPARVGEGGGEARRRHRPQYDRCRGR